MNKELIYQCIVFFLGHMMLHFGLDKDKEDSTIIKIIQNICITMGIIALAKITNM